MRPPWKSCGNFAPTTDITFLAYHPSKPIIASVSKDRTVPLWNLEPGNIMLQEELRASVELQSVTFSPSGKRLAAAGADRVGRVWDLEPSPAP